jgi:hypothetical protein
MTTLRTSAFSLRGDGEEDLHHEAAVEHEAAKRLIADIEASGPDDD